MFLGACMSMLPNSRCAGFANAFPLGLAGVLENIDIDTTNVNVVECLPQRDKLQNIVTVRATASCLSKREYARTCTSRVFLIQGPLVFVQIFCVGIILSNFPENMIRRKSVEDSLREKYYFS